MKDMGYDDWVDHRPGLVIVTVPEKTLDNPVYQRRAYQCLDPQLDHHFRQHRQVIDVLVSQVDVSQMEESTIWAVQLDEDQTAEIVVMMTED